MAKPSDVESQLAQQAEEEKEQSAAEEQAQQEAEEEQRRQEELNSISAQQLLSQRKQSSIASIEKTGKKVVKAIKWWRRIAAVAGIGSVLSALAGILFIIIVGAIACNEGFLSWIISCGGPTIPGSQVGSGGGGGGTKFGFNIVVTSAYRPNSTGSAHQRGEAVDMAIRPSPTSNNDPRIDQLVAIAKSVFPGPSAGARGDTLDEYRNPTEQATGGHVHVEFNTYTSNGKTFTYCDDTVVKIPPTDLVDLPYTAEGITPPNQAKVRPCMLNAVSQIFSAAQ